MGCDIHLYIEHKEPAITTWAGFGGRINPGRYYGLFAKLAGVRNYDEIKPVAEPRGMPDDASWIADADNRLYITDSEGEGYASPENAALWVQEGNSKYIDNEAEAGKHVWVTHPDWHSHSWLTPDEYSEAISGTSGSGWLAILACLRSFESQGEKARVVFWFDN